LDQEQFFFSLRADSLFRASPLEERPGELPPRCLSFPILPINFPRNYRGSYPNGAVCKICLSSLSPPATRRVWYLRALNAFPCREKRSPCSSPESVRFFFEFFATPWRGSLFSPSPPSDGGVVLPCEQLSSGAWSLFGPRILPSVVIISLRGAHRLPGVRTYRPTLENGASVPTASWLQEHPLRFLPSFEFLLLKWARLLFGEIPQLLSRELRFLKPAKQSTSLNASRLHSPRGSFSLSFPLRFVVCILPCGWSFEFPPEAVS